ncbi:unnamed protein product [Haemonchus placei]|uniref:Uncharacterized protein n=1 Tax=Haemonchus placei TaxID=6290 RepID=A0A0N4W1P3_HAEPC|nr:unnamed protein product [Haemonchus placei]
MFYYPEGPLPQLSRNRGSFSSPSMRPMSSLSSGSADSDFYGIHPPPPSSVVPPPPSLSSSTSRPPSPGLQVSALEQISSYYFSHVFMTTKTGFLTKILSDDK